jgi:hypothetical protein
MWRASPLDDRRPADAGFTDNRFDDSIVCHPTRLA